MDYQQFCELLKMGETRNVIFKEECNAFNGSSKDNVELAKEIIALANNETKTNYIVIGVSSGTRVCKTVKNQNLNDQNLQEFCQANIVPPPVVKLQKVKWENANNLAHRDKVFVIIEVEAQAQQCFRFNQDSINFQEQYHCRKGEVWVRHETATELASPEEIKELFEKKVGVKDKAAPPVADKVIFSDQPYVKVLPYILAEFKQMATKAGGKFFSGPDPFINRGGPSLFHHIVLPINGQPFLLRVVPIEKCIERGQISDYCQTYLTFEHGLILVSLGNVSEASTINAPVKIRQPWGWFCANEFWHLGLKERGLNIALPEKIMDEVDKLVSPCIILANISSDESLRKAWSEMLNSLVRQEEYLKIINTNRSKINNLLSFFIKEGCVRAVNKIKAPKKLLENEVYDPEKYGNILLVKQPEVCEALRNLLQECQL